jgi:hypothetical protein
MQDIKRKNMKEDYSCIPDYETFSESEAKAIVKAIKSVYSISDTVDSEVEEEILKKSVSVSLVNDDFSLTILGENLGIEIGDSLFVSWNKFEEIDTIKTEEFEEYFFDLWYEGIDNIEIFDSTLEWIIFILRNGDIRLIRGR